MNCPQKVHSILPMVAATREGFQRLKGDLVTSLVQESLGTVVSDIGTYARHVIDIVVRNLYERTADLGFLATDQALCRFVADQGAPGPGAGAVPGRGKTHGLAALARAGRRRHCARGHRSRLRRASAPSGSLRTRPCFQNLFRAAARCALAALASPRAAPPHRAGPPAPATAAATPPRPAARGLAGARHRAAATARPTR